MCLICATLPALECRYLWIVVPACNIDEKFGGYWRTMLCLTWIPLDSVASMLVVSATNGWSLWAIVPGVSETVAIALLALIHAPVECAPPAAVPQVQLPPFRLLH